MNLSDIDLRLLEMFIAVVESRGVANAQTLLNRDASTISRQLRQLEDKLELRLCERGRRGFQLTPDGEKIFRYTLALKQAVQTFEDRTESLKGHLSGQVRLAIIDNLITDPNCPLRAAYSPSMARVLRIKLTCILKLCHHHELSMPCSIIKQILGSVFFQATYRNFNTNRCTRRLIGWYVRPRTH